MEPESLTILSPDASHVAGLHDAMVAAFSDYVVPMRPTRQQFDQMMRQRSLSLPLSAVAVIDGRIAAFWLIGQRGERSYLIVSGTRPEFRRHGLSRRIADRCFALARGAGATAMSAEVIATNTRAVALYMDLGFDVNRTLDCYSLPRSVPDPAPGVETREAAWHALGGDAVDFGELAPSWQNEAVSLEALGDGARWVAAYVSGELAGYAAWLVESGTVAQIAVRRSLRRRGVGSALLSAIAARSPADLRLLNADARDAGFRAFMQARGAKKTVEQLEIRRVL